MRASAEFQTKIVRNHFQLALIIDDANRLETWEKYFSIKFTAEWQRFVITDDKRRAKVMLVTNCSS